MIAKLGKLLLYAFVAWFVWVSWKAVPHFSRGLDEGLEYYHDEVVWLLNGFASAGIEALNYARGRTEAMRYSEQMQAERVEKPGRFRTLREPAKE